jgi:hypothetical protein
MFSGSCDSCGSCGSWLCNASCKHHKALEPLKWQINELQLLCPAHAQPLEKQVSLDALLQVNWPLMHEQQTYHYHKYACHIGGFKHCPALCLLLPPHVCIGYHLPNQLTAFCSSFCRRLAALSRSAAAAVCCSSRCTSRWSDSCWVARAAASALGAALKASVRS